MKGSIDHADYEEPCPPPKQSDRVWLLVAGHNAVGPPKPVWCCWLVFCARSNDVAVAVAFWPELSFDSLVDNML